MKSFVFACVAAVLLTAGAAFADAPDCPRHIKAAAALNAAFPDLQKEGIAAVRKHLDELEGALADMDKPCPQTDGDVEVLTDGMMETLVAMAEAAKVNPGKRVVAVSNPYPMIGLLLGSYYNEIKHYEDAVRVFDRERAFDKGNSGVTRPGLAGERGAALGQLHRLAEALAAYDEGIALIGIADRDKARMYRGRGFILTEMERLDEAEAAYEESLKLEPGNTLALGELDYIKKLRFGGRKAPTSGFVPLPPPEQQPPASPQTTAPPSPPV
jgi:tetratricopeptide (TPR) repeat protein